MPDCRTARGSNAIIPPLALGGPVLTIRKFSRQPFTLERLVELKTLRLTWPSTWSGASATCQRLVISGGTGSGKTSTLNALGRVISLGVSA